MLLTNDLRAPGTSRILDFLLAFYVVYVFIMVPACVRDNTGVVQT